MHEGGEGEGEGCGAGQVKGVWCLFGQRMNEPWKEVGRKEVGREEAGRAEGRGEVVDSWADCLVD